MDWRLAGIIAVGTLPGLAVGWWLRVHWLADPHAFKFFTGIVLATLALKLLRGAGMQRYAASGATGNARYSTRGVFALALLIGMIGGAYGIGGGAFMAPFLVAIFGLSLHATAGATLFGTFITSVVGVALYQFLPAPTGIETQPDWALGILFGLGGAVGMYAGARTQKHVPQRTLELGIAVVLVLLAGNYVIGYWLSGVR
jgi:hypothetical protein